MLTLFGPRRYDSGADMEEQGGMSGMDQQVEICDALSFSCYSHLAYMYLFERTFSGCFLVEVEEEVLHSSSLDLSL